MAGRQTRRKVIGPARESSWTREPIWISDVTPYYEHQAP
jgi:hypothetical protein